MPPKKKARKSAAGEFTPSQFATCVGNGLNIHVYDKLTATNHATFKKQAMDNAPVEEKPSAAGGEEAVNNDAATNMMAFPRVECTNGAMEALRLCHSAFLSAVASSLGEMDSSSKEDDDRNAATSKKRKSSSISTGIKTMTEQDVMRCMEQMGLSSLAQRAMTSISHNNSANNKVSAAQKKKKKGQRKKDPFANYNGTQEELIAEQERLLSESAQRIQRMNEAERKDG